LKGLDVNKFATMLLGCLGFQKGPEVSGYYFVGTVILVRNQEDDESLHDQDLAQIQAAYEKLIQLQLVEED